MISRTTNNLRVWPLLASARSSAAVVMSTDSGKSDQVDGSNSSFSNRLRFDNRALAVLPVERNQSNYVRGVSNSIFSRVKPTPLSTPKLVIYSGSAIRLLDLTDEDTQTDEFVQHFAGNRLWTGSDPASQCYCGHQFGVFAGQLGDGAAIYLGEVINSHGQRWELQLKGAGMTPYSRSADGRKVLRSSIREFLCSEAMHHLGIPSTRAATCIVSSDRVLRDMFYDGHGKMESCAVISRIAETFIRFGTFENFKTRDPETGRIGSCVGRTDILETLFDYVMTGFYADIVAKHVSINDAAERRKLMCQDFYSQVVDKTANLVALWQSVGFCHGVLNTDNMSIVGLTLDYGPFCFLERFDPACISNTSDDSGRYSFFKQPITCKWNLFKLAQMLTHFVPLEELLQTLETRYFDVYHRVYFELMRKKLGLKIGLDETSGNVKSDQDLVSELLELFKRTGSDFTNCFRTLSRLTREEIVDQQSDFKHTIDLLLKERVTLETFIDQLKEEVDCNDFRIYEIIMQTNPGLLTETPNRIQHILDKKQLIQELQKLNENTRNERDRQEWTKWLKDYCERIRYDCGNRIDDEFMTQRTQSMNQSNPKFILRNHVLQTAIEQAEKDNFEQVRQILKLAEHPFDDPPDDQACHMSSYYSVGKQKIKVSCSS